MGQSEFQAKRGGQNQSPTGSDQAYSDEDENDGTPHEGDAYDKDSLEEEESKAGRYFSSQKLGIVPLCLLGSLYL